MPFKGPSNIPAELIFACECQLDKQEPWEVLDTATDLSVHFLVVSLTTVIYPFAPLLFLAQLVSSIWNSTKERLEVNIENDLKKMI